MSEAASTHLLSSETISAIAELWKLGACILIFVTCLLFRNPISQILLNLRKIKRNNTEIELSPTVEEGDTQEPSLSLSQKAPPNKSNGQIPEVPKNDDSLFSEMFNAIFLRENDRARELRDQWIDQDTSKGQQNKVLYLRLMCKLQKNAGAADELEELRHDEAYSDQIPIILMTLGEFYESIEQHARAMQLFQDWEEATSNPLDKANAVIAKSRIMALSETPEASLRFLQLNISRFTDHECLAQIYYRIAEVYLNLNNDLMRSVALEKVVEFSPTDSDFRFEAAYAQSSADLSHLSLNNYEKELELNPFNSLARNNLAVQLSNFGLLSKSVEQYDKARTDGNSLAAANLAYLYIEKGLLGDAITLLREAQRTGDYHENVNRALTELHTMEESDNKKLAIIRRWMPVYQKFLRQYADARLILRNDVQRFDGTWSSEGTGAISIIQENDRFRAEWGSGSSMRKLEGVQDNRSAELKLYSAVVNPFSYNEGPVYGAPHDALGYISDDGTKLEILSYRAEQPQVFSLVRDPSD